jgi:hypothetical protein
VRAGIHAEISLVFTLEIKLSSYSGEKRKQLKRSVCAKRTRSEWAAMRRQAHGRRGGMRNPIGLGSRQITSSLFREEEYI